MEAKFLKQKFTLIILSSLFLNILVGCSSSPPTNTSTSTPTNASASDSSNKKDSSIPQEGKKVTSKDSSKEATPSKKPEEDKNYKNSTPSQTAKAIGKVKLYEGTYFDDRRFGDNVLESYCEIAISNITDTSFDFTIYQLDSKTKEKKVIFLKNTALFIGDGTTAAFYGKSYTLNFTFPNNHGAYPIVTDMKISGFEPLEGKTYVNNGIPGHEFG